jgi:hypothetical protein
MGETVNQVLETPTSEAHRREASGAAAGWTASSPPKDLLQHTALAIPFPLSQNPTMLIKLRCLNAVKVLAAIGVTRNV